jgi:hypothetical protein
MLYLADTSPPIATSKVESRQLIAADLRLLIAQVETSMRRIVAAMDQEHGSDPEGSADVVLLDDVTPRYARASAALVPGEPRPRPAMSIGIGRPRQTAGRSAS